MLRYDHNPGRQRDAIAQRQAFLDTIVDYRFLAPARIAADELREREMTRAARSRASRVSASAPRQWAAALRVRLGTALVAFGTRLLSSTPSGLDTQPET